MVRRRHRPPEHRRHARLELQRPRLVREGTGYLLTFGGIVGEDDTLCFRPLSPTLTTKMHVIWRRGGQLTRAAQALLDEMRRAQERGEENAKIEQSKNWSGKMKGE